MSKKTYLRKISDAAIVGGISAIAMTTLIACGNGSSNTTDKVVAKQGAIVTLEEQPDGKYKILEEVPSSETRVIVKGLDGSERILSKQEVDAIVAAEAKKVDDGTSQLTQPNGGDGNGGFGLGSAILASAAGAIIGSYIGNKLFNNPNFKQNQQRNYKSPQAYERSRSSFNKGTGATTARAGATPSSARGGFFNQSGRAGGTGVGGASSFGG
ncbi:UPF0323 family lipoprotein [Helicobacter sp. 11S02629-2]|uniref:UPF0323 family lipoprotein n=1 Tax=Helicobacter sp. 11S02629-2 TaxID=1476195 RepID=UPI000BA52C6C|nr:UPF0323 family lipoprotein [Helicobacter sp. 11S02629-2]PAF45943.1 hypothetical protein BKH40_00590 [Helicobacter sp. 11S02629-2]